MITELLDHVAGLRVALSIAVSGAVKTGLVFEQCAIDFHRDVAGQQIREDFLLSGSYSTAATLPARGR